MWQQQHAPSRMFRVVCAVVLGLPACAVLTGCMVAGFSRGGSGTVGFIWPGGLGLIFVLMVVLWFLLRRR